MPDEGQRKRRFRLIPGQPARRIQQCLQFRLVRHFAGLGADPAGDLFELLPAGHLVRNDDDTFSSSTGMLTTGASITTNVRACFPAVICRTSVCTISR